MSSDEENVRARELAHALYDLKGYQKAEVARHICGKTSFARAVLKHYLDLFSFDSMDLLEAIRAFVNRFSLLGEAHEQGRIIAAFAVRFCAQHTHLSSTADAFCQLASALLLLNQDLHNPAVSKKMTYPEFCRNLAGFNDGGDFAKSTLKGFYTSIKEEEIKFPTEGSGSDDPLPVAPEPSRLVSVRKGGNHECLRLFQLGDALGEKLREGTLLRKDTMDTATQSTARHKRGWQQYHVLLLGARLIFHRQSEVPYTADEWTQSMSDACLVRHSLAREALDYAKRQDVFRLTLSHGQEMLLQAKSAKELLAWVTSINTVAALESAPPLPSAVSSSKGFKRPTLPESKSKETAEEQLARYKAQLRSLETQASQHRRDQGSWTTKQAKQFWTTKDEYMAYERQRIGIYIDILAEYLSGTTGLMFTQQPSFQVGGSGFFRFRRNSTDHQDQTMSNLFYGYEAHEQISWV